MPLSISSRRISRWLPLGSLVRPPLMLLRPSDKSTLRVLLPRLVDWLKISGRDRKIFINWLLWSLTLMINCHLLLEHPMIFTSLNCRVDWSLTPVIRHSMMLSMLKLKLNLWPSMILEIKPRRIFKEPSLKDRLTFQDWMSSWNLLWQLWKKS